MPKLLIVDDDEYIRSGLKHLIDWEELGVEIVGEAEGGRQAIGLFLETTPQIVLTDIRMPDGDGLELIANIRKKGWDTHIVVLSGYDDFSYVRQTMRYQVEDYLLKPVDAAELKEIIKSCCEELEHRWIEEQLRKESFQLLRHNVFVRWAENRIDYEQLREKLDFLNEHIIGHNRFLQTAVISWHDVKEGSLTESERKFRSFAILNTVEEAMATEQRGVAFLNSNNQIACIFSGEEHDLPSFAQSNRKWMHEQSLRLSKLLKTPWYCTLGIPVKQPQSLHVSYRDALRLQDVIDLTGEAKCVDREEVTGNLIQPVPEIASRDSLIPSILQERQESWQDTLEQDFAWVISQPDPLSAAKYVGAEWIATIKETSRKLRADTAESIIADNTLTDMFSRTNASSIKQMIIDAMLKLQEVIRREASRKKHSLIQQVEAYLRESFHEELSLKTLSDKFNVSSIYLGRLFKAETGQYFSDYINQLRLEEAKRLLRETHMKASDIAGQVGFLDPNYFYRKFKQTLGLSPTDYRNLHHQLT